MARAPRASVAAESDEDMEVDTRKEAGSRRRNGSTNGNAEAGPSSPAPNGHQRNGRSRREVDEDEEEEGDEAGENGQQAANRTNGNADAEDDDDEQGIVELDEQSESEKRKIRKGYRDLTSNLMANKNRSAEAVNTAALREGIETVNRLFDQVKNPAEAVLDSSYLILTSDLVKQQARKLKIGGDYFDADDFVGKIKTVISGGVVRRTDNNRSPKKNGSQRGRDADDEEEDEDEKVIGAYKGWDIMGKLATRFTLRIPAIDFMLGPLAVPQKKKPVRKKKAAQQADEVVPVKKAQEVKQSIVKEDQSTTNLIKHVAEILEEAGGQEGINFFLFVVNPRSFSQTVENIFFASFLVKEMKAAISFDNDAEPIIYLAEPPTEEDRQSGELKARQLVLEFDHDMWRDAIEAYDITESTIPHREYAKVEKGQWYAS